jgi:hypothetical protein
MHTWISYQAKKPIAKPSLKLSLKHLTPFAGGLENFNIKPVHLEIQEAVSSPRYQYLRP